MGMGMGSASSSGSGSGSGGVGNGKGGDDSNSGPKGKINDVKGVTHSASQVGESGMVYSAGETKGAPDSAAAASVPYTDVISGYKKSAEKSLAKENVPPAHRTRVKKYFDSLE